MIELIIVIATIALLLAVLIPALKAARATAYQARCHANLRQVGALTVAYAQDFNFAVMPSEPWFWSPRLPPVPGGYLGEATSNYYDVFWPGMLATRHYLTQPDILYCPADPWSHSDQLSSTGRLIGNWIPDVNRITSPSYGLNYLGFGIRYLPLVPTDMWLPVNGQFWKLYQVKRPAKTFYLADNSDQLNPWTGSLIYPDFADDADILTYRHGDVLSTYWIDGHVSAPNYRAFQSASYYAPYFVGGTPKEYWFDPAR